jgi:hypothetical protein
MPMFRRKPTLVEAVQWKDDDETWEAVRALHADSELVAFRNDDGTVSIETPDGRMAAEADDWIVKHPGFFNLYTSEGFAANFESA